MKVLAIFEICQSFRILKNNYFVKVSMKSKQIAYHFNRVEIYTLFRYSFNEK